MGVIMKKTLMAAFCAAALIITASSAASCSTGNPSEATQPATASQAEKNQSGSKVKSASKATSDSAEKSKIPDKDRKIVEGSDDEKIDALVESDEMKKKAEQMKLDAENKGYDFKIYRDTGDDGTYLLVFEYTAKSGIDDGMKQRMENSLKEEKTNLGFNKLAESMKDDMGISKPGVRVIIDGGDGANSIVNTYKPADGKDLIPPKTPDGVTGQASKNKSKSLEPQSSAAEQ